MSLLCDMPNLKSNPNYRNYYPKVVNNQLCKFSNQPVWLPKIPPEINSIEINFEFTTGDEVGGGSYWVLLGQKGSNRTCPQIEIDGSQIQFYTSYDTSSWLTRMVAPVETNTTYVLNAKWNNVDKQIVATLTDKNGTTVSLTVYSGYTDTTDGIVWEDYGALCSDQGGWSFNGLFDLAKSYIKINGRMWWRGLVKTDCSNLLVQPYEALGGAQYDAPVKDIGTMYQNASVDGTTWSGYSELTTNTVAELAKLRPFSSSDTGLLNYWDYTGVLSLTVKFTYRNDVNSAWYGNSFGIIYANGDGNYHSGVAHVENNQLRLAYQGAPTKQLTANHTYTMKLSLNADTNKVLLYCKEEGVDSDFVLIDTKTATSSASVTRAYVYISNALSEGWQKPYHKFADFDLSDITIDIDGEVIFSRA